MKREEERERGKRERGGGAPAGERGGSGGLHKEEAAIY